MINDARPVWAVRLEAERERRGWNKHEMARRLLAAVGNEYMPVKSMVYQVRRWESGAHFPRDWAAAYADAYGITEEELFGTAKPGSATAAWPVGMLTPTTDRSIAEWMSSMERRNLLMLMGLGVAAPWPVAENLRTTLSRVAGASDSVTDWRETVEDHARAMPTTPPAQILPDLLSDINEVNALLEAGHPRQKEMLEVAAALAAFTSRAAYDVGQPGKAFRWWRTAQQLADKSEYAPIRAYIRAHRGRRVLLHNSEDAPRALKLANEAVNIAKDQPSRGLAEAQVLRMDVLAIQGSPQARAAFDEFSRIAERQPGSPFWAVPWHVAYRIQDAQTRMYARLGDGDAAVRAGRTHPGPETQMYVAAGLVQAGEVDEGIGHAVTTLTHLDPVHDRLSVRQMGRDVLAVVPVQARTSTTAQELRALTLGRPVA